MFSPRRPPSALRGRKQLLEPVDGGRGPLLCGARRRANRPPIGLAGRDHNLAHDLGDVRRKASKRGLRLSGCSGNSGLGRFSLWAACLNATSPRYEVSPIVLAGTLCLLDRRRDQAPLRRAEIPGSHRRDVFAPIEPARDGPPAARTGGDGHGRTDPRRAVAQRSARPTWLIRELLIALTVPIAALC